jgi:hypothetical protein
VRVDNPASFRGDPRAVGYFIYVTYMGLGAIDTARLAYRFTRLGSVPLLRLGLLMVTGGAIAASLYAAVHLSALAVGLMIDRNLYSIAAPVIHSLTIVSALLVSVGSTVPSWGRFVGAHRTAEWIGDYISHLSLRPLWEALYAVKPQIALHFRSRWADRLLLGDLRFRLTRRVIEIRDGLLLLRSYRTHESHAQALDLAQRGGLHGNELAAAVEAIEIALSLRAMNRTDTAGQDVESVSPPTLAATDFDGVTASIVDEVHWLTQVAQAFRRLPVVHEVLHGHSA